MTGTGYNKFNNHTNCNEHCGCTSCANFDMNNPVHAALAAVCAFLLVLMAIICGAIISVIINVAIICIIGVIIIKSHNRTCTREVYIA